MSFASKFVGIVLASATVLLVGCLAPLHRAVDRGVTEDARKAFVEVDRARDRNDALQDMGAIWVGGAPVAVKTSTLPPALSNMVTFRSSSPVTLHQVAEFISTTVGVPVQVSPDAVEHAAIATVDPQAAALGNTTTPGAFSLQYEGTAHGLLDQLAARTGNSWAWRSGSVAIFHYDTRTFFVSSLPGRSTLNNSVGNKSQSGGQGAGASGGEGGSGSQTQTSMLSGQTTTMESTVDSFDAIASAVKAMLSAGGRTAVSDATSSITVTDQPAVIDRVGEFIASLNDRLTRQVMVEVRVVSVELNENEVYGIDWSGVYQNIGDKIGYALNSTSQLAGDGVNNLNLAVINPTSPAFGSSVLLNALATQGNLSVKTSAMVGTLSGQPVPVQVGRETTYLASSETTQVALGAAQVSIKPGTVSTGFAMTLLPVVLDGDDILVQVAVSISTLRELRVVGSTAANGARIETPTIDSRQFMQRVKLRSGSTLVMSGFEQDSLQADSRGVGSPKFWALGGGTNSRRGRTVLVIILTPRLA